MDKFYYICRASFIGKENKQYYTIDYYSEDMDVVLKCFVNQQVYNNYNNVKAWTEISKNKISVEKSKNKYGQIVVSYKINN